MQRAIINMINYIFSIFRLKIIRLSDNNIFNKTSALPQVRTLIDIGVGDKGTPDLYRYFQNARLIFIDPLDECRVSIKSFLGADNDNVFISVALGAENGSAIIKVADDIGGSSFLNSRDVSLPWRKTIENRKVPIKRLDDAIAGFSLEAPLGIKIDTEGFELEVLKGAPETLQNSSFVIVEYHGSGTIKTDHSLQDIIDHMVSAGFFAYFMLPDGVNIVFLKEQKD